MLCLQLESQCEGSVSLCLKISEIINLRHQDLTIDTYNTAMLNAREDLLKMNVNPEIQQSNSNVKRYFK